ncbi:alpha/beta hydrolase [Rhizobium sp. WYCCWR 11152]|uniref:alpha/beta fold hydrolase n=1 Tax=Rhizobium sp. WYCCWR 11152 TaxID=2692316 RepID=UPI0032B25815
MLSRTIRPFSTAIRKCNSTWFGDYKSNIALYPRWQEYLRATRPPVLAVWGSGDPSFASAGAHAYRKDVSDAEIHLFDTGHFALETDGPAIAAVIRDFLSHKGCYEFEQEARK